jgi:hypothetical protein
MSGKIFLAALLIFCSSSHLVAQQNVSISDTPATPDPSSVLDVKSVTKGMLMPRMTTAQRNAIISPANGLLVFDTNIDCVMYYSSTTASWNSLCTGSTATSLIANTSPVTAGPLCPSGGILLELGNDTNSNGALEAGEVTSSEYVCNGATGAQGPAGPQGPVGATGAQGPAGPQGPIGATGAQGPQGPAGATGAQGAQGPAGATGATGPAGVAGATGASGPQGIAGTNGINCWDLNANGTNDPSEDVNGDGSFTSADCTGPDSYCPTASAGYIPVFTSSTAICNSILFQSGNNIGVNTTSPVVSVQINATDAIGIPSGTTGQQPSGAPIGSMRFNTTTGVVEVFNGTCWQNVNTPPIGATYVQWFNAADPNAIYPCTQWVATDIASGEFIRARGGASNVAAGGSLTGTVQTFATETHQHTGSVTINNATGLATTSSGSHNHGGSTGGYNDIGSGCGTPKYVPYDDNTGLSNVDLTGETNSPSLTCPWNGKNTVGAFLGRLDNELNHNHSISSDGSHTHTIPDHNHTGSLTINDNSGNTATETRPTNVAVIFWRRVN